MSILFESGGISAGRGEISLKVARKHSLQASFHGARKCCAGSWGEEIASQPVVDPACYNKTFQARHAHWRSSPVTVVGN